MNYQRMWMMLKHRLQQNGATDFLKLMDQVEYEEYEDFEYQQKKRKTLDTALWDVVKKATK